MFIESNNNKTIGSTDAPCVSDGVWISQDNDDVIGWPFILFFFCLFCVCVTEDWVFFFFWYEGIYFNYTAANEINTTTKTTTPNMGPSRRYILCTTIQRTTTTINTQHFESLRQLSVSKVIWRDGFTYIHGQTNTQKNCCPVYTTTWRCILFFWQKPGKGNNFW